MEQQRVEIHTTEIRLDGLLKFSGIAGTGGEAKFLVQSGRIRVNGAGETRRSRRLQDGDRVELIDEDEAVQADLIIAAPTTRRGEPRLSS